MDPEIAAELEWADTGEQVLFREMNRAQVLVEQRLQDDPGSMLGEAASAGDVALLNRSEIVVAFRRVVAEQARNGVSGSVDDTLACGRGWGFDLGGIAVPVLLTYGNMDSSCPPSHGPFLASAIPTSLTFEVQGGGHFADDPRAEILATHRWLRQGMTPAYPGTPVAHPV